MFQRSPFGFREQIDVLFVRQFGAYCFRDLQPTKNEPRKAEIFEVSNRYPAPPGAKDLAGALAVERCAAALCLEE